LCELAKKLDPSSRLSQDGLSPQEKIAYALESLNKVLNEVIGARVGAYMAVSHKESLTTSRHKPANPSMAFSSVVEESLVSSHKQSFLQVLKNILGNLCGTSRLSELGISGIEAMNADLERLKRVDGKVIKVDSSEILRNIVVLRNSLEDVNVFISHLQNAYESINELLQCLNPAAFQYRYALIQEVFQTFKELKDRVAVCQETSEVISLKQWNRLVQLSEALGCKAIGRKVCSREEIIRSASEYLGELLYFVTNDYFNRVIDLIDLGHEVRCGKSVHISRHIYNNVRDLKKRFLELDDETYKRFDNAIRNRIKKCYNFALNLRYKAISLEKWLKLYGNPTEDESSSSSSSSKSRK